MALGQNHDTWRRQIKHEVWLESGETINQMKTNQRKNKEIIQ